MSFQDVSPGDPWQTEPAVRYNAVNYLLRSFAGEVPEEKEMSDFRLVDFINSSSDTIRAFTAVAIIQDEYNGSPEELQSRFGGYTCVRGIPAVDDSCHWGITLEDVQPRQTGTMTLTGLVPAWITGRGKMAAPSAAGLVAGNTGSAAIISQAEIYAGTPYPGIILLNGKGGNRDEYMGQFKITALSPSRASITYPGDDTVCGYTDVPGCESIPNAEIEVGEGVKNIYLAFYYVSANNYSYRFVAATAPPDDTPVAVFLGTFNNGGVRQVFTTPAYSGRLVLSDDWYL
ncbi:MAG: hypothetical protein IKC82_00215 [Lentisphaeria bacterium]|nr:hypothetical protein [Lentisphaeria bacterium]